MVILHLHSFLDHISVRVLRRRVHRRPSDDILLFTCLMVDRESLIVGEDVPRAQLLLVLIHLLVQSHHANCLKLRIRVIPRQDCAQVIGGSLLLPRGVLELLKMVR